VTSIANYSVRAVSCDHRASDEEVYQALKRATDRSNRSWDKIRAAKRITIKFNQAWPPERLVYLEGQLQELVSFSVARATLRLIANTTPRPSSPASRYQPMPATIRNRWSRTSP